MRHVREFVTLLQLAGVPLKQGELMCRHTSFQIGGPVAVMAFPENRDQMMEIINLSRQYSVVPMIMGAGSNMLCPDEGLDTVMIQTRTNMTRMELLEGNRIKAQCGVTLAKLAAFALENGLTGLEFAHGIPGTLGGGIYMNAGAYGGEISQVLESVTILSRDGTVREDIPADDLDLSYRHSCFMENDAIILYAIIKLQPGDKDQIKAKMDDLMQRRRTSQPLEYPSAGSTFKRPVGGYAAALIDEAGLKGFTVGGAQVSEKHAGFVINRGRATCKDVLELMAQVQQRVRAHSGIDLEPEVRVTEVKR